MGELMSKESPHESHQYTFGQLLDMVSHKADELVTVLKNMKKDRKNDRGSEVVAVQYLANALCTVERELRHVNTSLAHMVKQIRDREQRSGQARYYHYQEQQYHTATPRETPDSIQKQLSSTQNTLEELREENKALKKNLNDSIKRNVEYKTESQKYETENQKLRIENGNLLHRPSKLTSDKLTADNPNIADLSDANRPTKLVEMMSELYDNQWTDAFVALQPLKNDEKLVVKILLHTFMDIYEFCKDKSRSLVSMTEKTMKDIFEDVNATMRKKDHMAKTKSATLCRANGKEMAGLIRQQSFDESNTIFLDWQDETSGKELEESGSFEEVKDVWPKVEGELKKARKGFGVAMVPIVTKVDFELK